MKRIYVSPEGRTSGTGSTSNSALDFVTAFGNILENDMTLILLPGLYEIDAGVVLTTFTGLTIYGEGVVIIDAKGEDFVVFELGSEQTLVNIRFRDCRRCVHIGDGYDKVLVANCFEYEQNFTLDNESEPAFQAEDATNVTFRNLTSYRQGIGFSILSGTGLYNCIGTGKMPYTAHILDGFDDNAGWIQTNGNVSHVITRHYNPVEVFQGTDSLALIASNPTAGVETALFQRTVGASLALDMSRGDILRLHLFALDVSGASGAIPYVFTIGSSGGTNSFNVLAGTITAGFNVLEFDLTSPDGTTGTIDLADITIIRLEEVISVGGSLALTLDHMSLGDASIVADFNAVPTYESADLMAAFRGTHGIESTTNPPPFRSTSLYDFVFDKNNALFETYVTGGLEGFPIGGLWQGAHLYLPEEPGHLRFATHRILGSWSNDETFFDTVTGIPGSDGEGFRLPIDESSGTVVTASNPATINFASTTADGMIRDEDDGEGWTFDKENNGDERVGALWTFTPAQDGTDDQGTGLAIIGAFAEFYLPIGMLQYIDETLGIEITVTSSAGSILDRVVPDDLVDGAWNYIQILFDDPESEIGTFDASDIDTIQVDAVVQNNMLLEGFAVDHVGFVCVENNSSGPIGFDANGGLLIDMSTPPYEEATVARAIGEPFLCRDVGALIYAYCQAQESAANGAYVNSRPNRQQLGTRTIEIRYAESKFARNQATLSGSIRGDWTPVSRLGSLAAIQSASGSDIWVQPRITLRNRTDTP